MQTTRLQKRVAYERLASGMDVYALKTPTEDVVIAHFVFPGGSYRTYTKQTVALLLGELLPGGSTKRDRSAMLDAFDALGASVSAAVDAQYLTVSVRSTKAVFESVLSVLFESLGTPKWSAADFARARARIKNVLIEAREDTSSRAMATLLAELFKKGHPLYQHESDALAREIDDRTLGEVRAYFRDTLSTVGACAVVAGDIDASHIFRVLASVTRNMPTRVPLLPVSVNADLTRTPTALDKVVSLRDKMNVDTYLAIPLAITRESNAYLPLSVGVHILGGGGTSRLFHVLRNLKGLTYGSYAGLVGFQSEYPGLLRAKAVFPHAQFEEGRAALREQVELFVTKGVNATELRTSKENIAGRFKVGLATTSGVCGAVLFNALQGRDVRYLDEYPDRVNALTLQEVNQSIHTELDYGFAVTAGAGAIDAMGKPIV